MLRAFQRKQNLHVPDLGCLSWTWGRIDSTDKMMQRIKWKLMTNFWVEQLLSLAFVKNTKSKEMPVMETAYMTKVLPINKTYQHFEFPSSIFSTHVSFQAWAKSMRRTSCMIMKTNPPMRPTYIQTVKKMNFLSEKEVNLSVKVGFYVYSLRGQCLLERIPILCHWHVR